MSTVQERIHRRQRLGRSAPSTRQTVPSTRSLDSTWALPLGTVLVGRYRIDRVLGSGGMAVVYRARDLVLRRDVAVKVYATASGESSAADAIEEARVAAVLNHPAVATVFDAGVASAGDREIPFLVLEHVWRGDLRQHVEVERPSWRDAAWIGVDLAEGLAHLHERGYLHRDVKPANVLMAGRDADGRLHAKLTDFGISSLIVQARPTSPSTLGTVAYLSPEQVDGLHPTARSDVYALGLVLLEALTGRTEYEGAAPGSVLERLHRDPVIPAVLPPPFAEVLRAMTDRIPGRRPNAAQTAGWLREVLAAGSARASKVGSGRRGVLEDRPDVADLPPRAFAGVTALATRLLSVPFACVVLQADGLPSIHAAVGWSVEPSPLDADAWPLGPGADEPWSAELPPRGAPEPGSSTRPRSFAGAPLLSVGGDRLGTLCVLDGRRRTFARAELEDLAELGALVARELELRVAARRALLAR